MARLKCNGEEIGRLETIYRRFSYRSNGWILSDYGDGHWRRFAYREDIRAAYTTDLRDQEFQPEARKRLQAFFHALIPRRYRRRVYEGFKLHCRRSAESDGQLGDVDGFVSYVEDLVQPGLVSYDEARELARLSVEYRRELEHLAWAVVIDGAASDGASLIAEMVIGNPAQRQERLKEQLARYNRPGYRPLTAKLRPALRSELEMYCLMGNEIWRGRS